MHSYTEALLHLVSVQIFSFHSQMYHYALICMETSLGSDEYLPSLS